MKVLVFLTVLINTQMASARTLESLWNDLDIKADKSQEKSVDIGGFFVSGKGGYAYSVKKVFLKAAPKFQRTDGYIASVGAGIGPLDHIRIGASGEAKVTYVRNYDKKNEALTALPKFIKSFPKTSKKIIDNKKGLNIGDSVRIEFSSGSSLSSGLSDLFERAVTEDFSILNSVGLSASVNRGTTFLIDVYRLNDSKIRLKMVAVRDTGTIDAGVDVGSALLASIGVPLAESVIKRIVKCGFKLNFSKKASKLHPTDTLMADYVIDLSTSKGSSLYDGFMKNLFLTQISKHISLFKSSKEFEDSIVPHIEEMDSVSMGHFLHDGLPPVRRIFKGRMLSDSNSVGATAGCFNLFDIHSLKFKNLSILRSYDEFNSPSDYIMYNVGIDKDGIFDDRTNNYHHIWTAERADQNDPLSARPVELNTLTLNKVLEDSYSRGRRLLWFIPSEHEVLVNELVNLYPFQINKDHFKGIFEKNSVNLVSNLKISLNKKVIDSMKVKGAEHARSWAEDTVSGLREVGVYYFLGNEHITGGGEDAQKAEPHLLNEYVSSLLPVVSPQDLDRVSRLRQFEEHDQRDYVFSHYNKMLNSKLFRQIGFPYFISLSSPEVLKQNLSFDYSLTIGEGADTKNLKVVQKGPESDISLKSLEILRIINNRAFDLSIEQ